MNRVVFACPTMLTAEDHKSPFLMVADVDGQLALKVRGVAPDGGIATATIIVTNDVMRAMTIACNNEMRKRMPMGGPDLVPTPKKEG